MKTIYETIHELEAVRREKKMLLERESKLTEPLCSDLGMMDDLYRRFQAAHPTRGRDTFILIAARVFSPKALAGSNLGSGVRNKMAQVLNVQPTVVSHAFDNLVFHYKRYRNFRHEVDTTFALMFGENE